MIGARVGAAAVALAIATGCGVGCGGDDKKTTAPGPVVVPERNPSAGDAVLAMAPAGADAVLELDFARLRDNGAVGRLVAALSADSTDAALRFDLLRDADLLVIASYEVGGDAPAHLWFVKGPRARAVKSATHVAKDVYAIGPELLVARAVRTAAGEEPSVRAGQPELLRVRALSMPKAAEGASVRVSAVLGFDARVALARELDLSEVPVAVSVWGDVADDLAVVGQLTAESDDRGKLLARSAQRMRDRVAKTPLSRRLGLSSTIARSKIGVAKGEARVTLVIGPRRLQELVDRLLRDLGVQG